MEDCRSCGACCFSDSSAYVRVTGRDVRRLGAEAAALVHVEDGQRYLRMEAGRCAALRVVGLRLVCSVYERRPAACRELERGSPPCLEEIRLKKVRALRVIGAGG